ncbi:MAG: ABC transporter permease [Proteobacteria bacterium]|nr:ABC transporter permease [Pseudomonadota bacterium]MDE3208666.1 ABC transporter permease [Pseudomonadota bacterium]
MKQRYHSSSLSLLFWLAGGLLLAFIVVPLFGLAMDQTPASIHRVLAMEDVRQAIILTIEAAVITSLIAQLMGVPLAYLLSRSRLPALRIVEAIVDIPLTVPHTVVGIALLISFGRNGMIGGPLFHWAHISFWGSFAGIVLCMLFVSLPYTVNAARIGFDNVDPRIEKVARTLGAGPWRIFMKVTLPLVWRSLATGFNLTLARSMSEFGSIVILAYYPETAPVKIYDLFLQFGLSDSSAMSLVILVLTLLIFILFRYFLFGKKEPMGFDR